MTQPTPDDAAPAGFDLDRAVAALFAEVSTLSLATVDAAGRAHAANLYVAREDGGALLFVSDPASAHSRHVAEHPDVAATAYVATTDWQRLRGVQLHGRCEPIGPGEADAAWEVYLRRFAEVAEMKPLIDRQQFYRITPTWLRYIDNRICFRFRRERHVFE